MNCLLLHKVQDLSYYYYMYHFKNFCQVEMKLLSSGNYSRVKMICQEWQKIKIEKKMVKFSKTLRDKTFEWSQGRVSTHSLET